MLVVFAPRRVPLFKIEVLPCLRGFCCSGMYITETFLPCSPGHSGSVTGAEWNGGEDGGHVFASSSTVSQAVVGSNYGLLNTYRVFEVACATGTLPTPCRPHVTSTCATVSRIRCAWKKVPSHNAMNRKHDVIHETIDVLPWCTTLFFRNLLLWDASLVCG